MGSLQEHVILGLVPRICDIRGYAIPYLPARQILGTSPRMTASER
jgi:hypothetical protein